jgi:protocatechuate 3,4-dioxygenase beta subunit
MAQLLRQNAQRRSALRVLGAYSTGVLLTACGGGSNDDLAQAKASTNGAAHAEANANTVGQAGIADGNFNMPTQAPAANTTAEAATSPSNLGSTTGAAPVQPVSQTGTAAPTADKVTSCEATPGDMAGPYPGNGTNMLDGKSANVLTLSGIVRSDIRKSIAGAKGEATGVALNIRFRVVNSKASCADLSGYVIYLWHNDAAGLYSMYDPKLKDVNYLRGVQETNAKGFASFITIYPGAYPGRAPHMHMQVFKNMKEPADGYKSVRTTQIAFPDKVSKLVYAKAGYESSAKVFSQTPLDKDFIFADGYSKQLVSISGDLKSGYDAELLISV